jgi:hypothetical protein
MRHFMALLPQHLPDRTGNLKLGCGSSGSVRGPEFNPQYYQKEKAVGGEEKEGAEGEEEDLLVEIGSP